MTGSSSSGAAWTASLRRVLTVVAQGLACLAVMSVALMAGANVVEVVARYVFSAPLNWGSDLSAFSLCACIFLALPEVTRRHQHAAISIVPDSLPVSIARHYRVAAFVICAALCIIVAWFAAEIAAQQQARGVLTTTANQIPRWWLTASVSLGLVLSAVNFLAFASAPPDGPLVEHAE